MSGPASLTAPAVTFWGAAQTVTGSMHVLQGRGRQMEGEAEFDKSLDVDGDGDVDGVDFIKLRGSGEWKA